METSLISRPLHPATTRSTYLLPFLLSLALIGSVIFVLMPVSTLTPNSLQQNNLIHDSTLQDLFSLWKLQHNKFYSSQEENLRFTVFSDNYNFILNHNAHQKSSYTLALNKFADLTQQEFKTLYTHTIQPSTTPKNVAITATTLTDLPDSVDWRQKGAVSAVYDEGICGSDWAFAAVGGLEGLYFNIHGNLVLLSEQQLIDCSSAFGNQGCQGGSIDPAYQYVTQYGIESAASYPYLQEQNTCLYNESQVVLSISGFTDVPVNDNYQLQVAVAQQVVSAAVEADGQGFQFYSGGIYSDPACGTVLDHAILIVGYGSQNGSDYWIVKNDWGSSWGLEGYIWLARTADSAPGQCGIAQGASYPNE